MSLEKYVVPFEKLSMGDVELVGGKNASLGEMINHLTKAGVKVPDGFATTSFAFNEFIEGSGLKQKISEKLKTLDVDDVAQLAKAGQEIRNWVEGGTLQKPLIDAVRQFYTNLGGDKLKVAVRSSATAEDLPDASFAGQQETFLNVSGIDEIIKCIKKVFASLFNDRAIAYRVHQGFEHDKVALSVGIQKMVRSDIGTSGVMFSIDTESGFDKVVFITGSYGLGEMVVQGSVNPDEFYVFKPSLEQGKHAVLKRNLGQKHLQMIFSADKDKLVEIVDVPAEKAQRFCLSDEELHYLTKQAILIEKHYQRPMDIEWAKDGESGEIFIVQARPETVQSRSDGRSIVRYELKNEGTVLAQGRAVGQRIGQGKAKLINSLEQMAEIKDGDVLVTDMTDPDWEPIMKRASAIVTNRGGRTCHAAIIARELGIPAVVGCFDATDKIAHNSEITVSCAQGEQGMIYEGLLPFEKNEHHLDSMPDIPFKIMMNIANPDRAFDFQKLPNEGVGLARLEFIISQMIGTHPEACLKFDSLNSELQAKIRERSSGYENPVQFYVERLCEGIATLGAAFHPKPVIIRFSDFKSNEYANLIGGQQFEPEEENPMIGFRGASRYAHPNFKDCFALECQAVRKVREEMGLDNIQVMIPFVRTLDEAKGVLAELKANGLERGKAGLKIIMMCELPTNALLADDYLELFDGFSIGSNDMTQLTLGLDRDSALVAPSFDERDPAVKRLLSLAIEACLRKGKYIGICGQGPSDHPDLAEWLVEQGIESVSLNPDTVLQTWLFIAKHLKK